MDFNIEKIKYPLFVSSMRIQSLKALEEEEGLSGWKRANEILPYAVCEKIISEIISEDDEGYYVSESQIEKIISDFGTYALRNFLTHHEWID